MKITVDLDNKQVMLSVGSARFSFSMSDLQKINEAVISAKTALKQAELDAQTDKIEEQLDSACDTRIRALVAQYAYLKNQAPVEARAVYSYCRNWTYPMSKDELRSEVEAAFIQARAADGTTSAKSMLERARCLATCYRVFHIDSVG